MLSNRFPILLVVLLIAGTLVNTWHYLGEAHVERKTLKDFPKQVGTWAQTGGDEQLSSETMAVLKASDYLVRNYRNQNGKVANYYIGYYATQRDGSTYHSPLNCLPGSGWVMSDPGTINISPKGRAPFVANKYLIQNGEQQELLVYWYQGRGRAVASEYWGKVYTVLDSVRMRRSDGAMIRIIIPVATTDVANLQSASDLASDFAADSSAILPEFVPD
jgi:EpsI family protein